MSKQINQTTNQPTNQSIKLTELTTKRQSIIKQNNMAQNNRFNVLYDALWEDHQKNPVAVNLTELCNNISNLHKSMNDKDALAHRETIAGLIIHHQTLIQRGIIPDAFPPYCRIMPGGRGMMIGIQSKSNRKTMPVELQIIIAKYLEVYKQT